MREARRIKAWWRSHHQPILSEADDDAIGAEIEALHDVFHYDDTADDTLPETDPVQEGGDLVVHNEGQPLEQHAEFSLQKEPFF
jgi:hypothetical protein